MSAPIQLLKKQRNALYYLKDKKTKEVIYGGAAGGGKSLFGCLWLIEQCINYPGTRWLMGRSKLKTLKETTLNTFFQVSTMLNISDLWTYNAQSGIITFNNGSEIILKDLFLYPSDPNFDSLGSLEITGSFIDECNQIVYKAWQIVKSRIRYKIGEYGITPKMLGTCNPSKNWVYSEFYKPSRDDNLKPDRAFIQALPTDNPFLPDSYLESLLSLDKASKERLYFGNWEFDDDPAALINFDAIQDLFTNDYVEGGIKYITADIALHGSDKFVAFVWDGWKVIDCLTMDKSGAKIVEEEIRKLSVKHKVRRSNICYDADGLGAYLKDYLKGAKAFHNGGSPLARKRELAGVKQEFKNLKSQCYFLLADKINKGEMYISINNPSWKHILIEELEVVKNNSFGKDQKLSVLPKEKVKELIGRSPDYSDALMMRMFFDLKSRVRKRTLGIA